MIKYYLKRKPQITLSPNSGFQGSPLKKLRSNIRMHQTKVKHVNLNLRQKHTALSLQNMFRMINK